MEEHSKLVRCREVHIEKQKEALVSDGNPESELVSKEQSSVSLGLQRSQLLMKTKTSDEQFSSCSCSISLWATLFVVKVEEEHLCSAQGPNQSHLTPLFFCELSCESGWRECVRVWGESECKQRVPKPVAIGPNKHRTYRWTMWLRWQLLQVP